MIRLKVKAIKMMKNLLLTLLLLITPLFSYENEKIILVDQDQSNYTIVIPKSATKHEKRAAAILQEYIQKMTNQSLPIVIDDQKIMQREISIGQTNRIEKYITQEEQQKLHPDGFIQRTKGKKLFLVGGSDKGIVYSVTDLLEKQFGCIKFSGEEEFIPRKRQLVINPINNIDNPATDFRVIDIRFENNDAYREWYRLDRIHDKFAHGYYVHTIDKLVPPGKYFDSHPEYFAMVNGERVKSQLCFSNPDIVNIMINQLEKDMAKQPNKKYWSVSQNDNAVYCQCPDCLELIKSEGAPSGAIIRLVNKVADHFPDKIISTLAYWFSRQAPKITKPRENVQIMLCNIECDRSKPISTNLDKECQQFVKDIQEWNQITDRIYLWDYTVNFSHTISPFPNLHTLQPNIKFFVNNSATAIFEQSFPMKGHEMAELKAYLLAKSLWNPNVNTEALQDYFLDHYFGDAAPWIQKYIQKLKTVLLESNQKLGVYQHPSVLSGNVLAPKHIAQYLSYFEEAEKAVHNQPTLLNRVKIAKLPIQYAIMETMKNNDQYEFASKSSMDQRLKEFYQVCKQNNITNLNENGVSPLNYEPDNIFVTHSSHILTNDNKRGFSAEYFDTINFRGTPVIKRVDREIANHYGTESPANHIPNDKFSIRWQTNFTADQAGEYTFKLTSDDGSRLYVNGELVINNWGDHAAITKMTKINLKANETIKLKIEYYEHQLNAMVKFGWKYRNPKKK